MAITQQESVERNDAAALFALAMSDDVAELETLLLRGVNVNIVDQFKRTPLHVAVDCNRFETVACLLAYGADPFLLDKYGRPAINGKVLSREKLHAIRQRFHRFKKRDYINGSSAEAQAVADNLEKSGLIRIPGEIEPELLESLRAGFATMVDAVETLKQTQSGRSPHYDDELAWWHNDRAYVCNNAFKYCRDLPILATRPKLLDIIKAYIGKPFHIQRANAMRYLPLEKSGGNQFEWHHDMEERRVKIKILLTDIEPDGQYMSYIEGTNRLFHPADMYVENNCPLEYCLEKLGDEMRVIKTVGKAGDVFLFDSNGAHRGRRSRTQTRDAIFIEYSCDKSQVWGSDVDWDIVNALSAEQQDAFDLMRTASKKWENPELNKRVLPDWLVSLPDVASWVR